MNHKPKPIKLQEFVQLRDERSLVTLEEMIPCKSYGSNKLEMDQFGEEMQNQQWWKRVDEGHGQGEWKGVFMILFLSPLSD